MFGHTINLNFNKEGDSHQTSIGGFFSMLIRVTMGIYVFMNFKKMLLFEDDSTFTEVNTLDLDEYGEKPYDETDMFMYHVIRKQKDSPSRLMLTEETARHIDIKYVQYEVDWYKYETDPDNYS
jgi:hypothetical protein